jgi:hypothetical protein
VNTYVCICIYSKVLGTRSHKFLQIERHPQPWSWELWIATETEIKVSVWQKEIIKLTPNLTVTCTSLGHISLFLNNNKALLGHHLVKSTYPESSVFIIRIAGVWPHVFPQNRNYKTRENHLFKNLLGSHSSISSKRASLSICSYYCPNLSSLNKINPFHIFTSWGMLICDTLWSALHPEYQAPVTCVERVGQRGAFLVNLFFFSGLCDLYQCLVYLYLCLVFTKCKTGPVSYAAKETMRKGVSCTPQEIYEDSASMVSNGHRTLIIGAHDPPQWAKSQAFPCHILNTLHVMHTQHFCGSVCVWPQEHMLSIKCSST